MLAQTHALTQGRRRSREVGQNSHGMSENAWYPRKRHILYQYNFLRRCRTAENRVCRTPGKRALSYTGKGAIAYTGQWGSVVNRKMGRRKSQAVLTAFPYVLACTQLMHTLSQTHKCVREATHLNKNHSPRHIHTSTKNAGVHKTFIADTKTSWPFLLRSE